MKIPTYPNDYEDFSEGVDITNEQINDWVKQGFEYLQNIPEAQFYNNGTGNTEVNIFREAFGEFNITISKNYMSYWVTS